MQPNFQLFICQESLAIKEYFQVKQQIFKNNLKSVLQSSTGSSPEHVSMYKVHIRFASSPIEYRYLALRENRLQ
jgi:hypothetical protein